MKPYNLSLNPSTLSSAKQAELKALAAEIHLLVTGKPLEDDDVEIVPTVTTAEYAFPAVRIDHPASEVYDNFTFEQIAALYELARQKWPRMECIGDWDTLSEYDKRRYKLIAYWELRGAKDSSIAAMEQMGAELPYSQLVADESRQFGWGYWRPQTLKELEDVFLPKPTPNIHRILQRCPQVAMIHALRGNVTEPYWWAALSITEHATPNYSRQCSDGYPGFSDEELGQRVERIRREKTKPALCTRLDSVNRDVCSVCRFRDVVRSPIALGYEHEPKSKAGRVS